MSQVNKIAVDIKQVQFEPIRNLDLRCPMVDRDGRIAKIKLPKVQSLIFTRKVKNDLEAVAKIIGERLNRMSQFSLYKLQGRKLELIDTKKALEDFLSEPNVRRVNFYFMRQLAWVTIILNSLEAIASQSPAEPEYHNLVFPIFCITTLNFSR